MRCFVRSFKPIGPLDRASLPGNTSNRLYLLFAERNFEVAILFHTSFFKVNFFYDTTPLGIKL